MKQHFTFSINGEISPRQHNFVSNSPKNAAKKIINRFLRDKHNNIYELNLTVINLQSNKRHFYKVLCHKNEIPIYKRITEFKTLELRFSVYIQNVPRDLVSFLTKQ